MNENHEQRNGIILLLFIITAACLIFITGFKPLGLDNDSQVYQTALDDFVAGNITIKEPSFILTMWLSNVLYAGNIQLAFVIYGLLAVAIKMTAMARYSVMPLLSLVIYLCIFFVLHDLTQIRIGVAAGFFMLAIPDFIENRRKPWLIKIGLAVLFHFSSVILLPLILLSNRRLNLWFWLALPFAILTMVLLIGDMNTLLLWFFQQVPAPLGPKAVGYITNLQLYGRFDNVNIFSKFSLCVIAFFIFYAITLLSPVPAPKRDLIFFKVISIMLSVFYLFSSVPVLASRTFELFGVVLIFALPSLALRVEQKKLLVAVIIAWSLVYFYVVNIKLINFAVL